MQPTDLEIEDLERFMSSLTRVHLSPFVLDAKAWSLFFQIILIKIILCGFVQYIRSITFSLTKFSWKSKVLSKVKVFARLVAYKKVNIVGVQQYLLLSLGMGYVNDDGQIPLKD